MSVDRPKKPVSMMALTRGRSYARGALWRHKSSAHPDRKYDRDFLLSPEKRNQVVELWEVEKYGMDPRTAYCRFCRQPPAVTVGFSFDVVRDHCASQACPSFFICTSRSLPFVAKTRRTGNQLFYSRYASRA